MQQTNHDLIKLQMLCNNQFDDPKLFGLIIYDFMAEYDKNAKLSYINAKIHLDSKNDVQVMQELAKVAAYEMELAYYEYRDYQINEL